MVFSAGMNITTSTLGADRPSDLLRAFFRQTCSVKRIPILEGDNCQRPFVLIDILRLLHKRFDWRILMA